MFCRKILSPVICKNLFYHNIINLHKMTVGKYDKTSGFSFLQKKELQKHEIWLEKVYRLLLFCNKKKQGCYSTCFLNYLDQITNKQLQLPFFQHFYISALPVFLHFRISPTKFSSRRENDVVVYLVTWSFTVNIEQ